MLSSSSRLIKSRISSSEANLKDFISCSSVAAIGGSWVCKKDDIANHDWDKITALSANAVKIIKETRA